MIALLCTAVGLALSFAPSHALWPGCGLLWVVALGVAYAVPEDSAWQQGALIGCSASIVLTALAVHVPAGLPRWAALALAVNAGFWCGALAGLADVAEALFALPLALVAVPGRWIVSRRYAIVLKILSGWLIAVALLSAALPLITTPGYKSDHME